MTITQHAHIYSFHTSNFILGQIIFLKFYQFHPYCQIAASVVGEHQELVVHGRVVTLIRQQWGWAGGTILISLFTRMQPGFFIAASSKGITINHHRWSPGPFKCGSGGGHVPTPNPWDHAQSASPTPSEIDLGLALWA